MKRKVLESPLNIWTHADIEALISRVEEYNIKNAGISIKRRNQIADNKKQNSRGLSKYGECVAY